MITATGSLGKRIPVSAHVGVTVRMVKTVKTERMVVMLYRRQSPLAITATGILTERIQASLLSVRMAKMERTERMELTEPTVKVPTSFGKSISRPVMWTTRIILTKNGRRTGTSRLISGIS